MISFAGSYFTGSLLNGCQESHAAYKQFANNS